MTPKLRQSAAHADVDEQRSRRVEHFREILDQTAPTNLIDSEYETSVILLDVTMGGETVAK